MWAEPQDDVRMKINEKYHNEKQARRQTAIEKKTIL